MSNLDATASAIRSRVSIGLLALFFFILPAAPGLGQEETSDAQQFTPFDGAADGRIVPVSAESHPTQPGPMPQRPASGIVDDLNVLSVKQRTAIARDLIISAVESDIHVYLLTLRKAPALPVDEYARGLLASWDAGPVAGLVLYVTDDTGPWQERLFVIPGEFAGAVELNRALAEAAAATRANALKHPNAAIALENAVRELLRQYRSLPAALRSSHLIDQGARAETATGSAALPARPVARPPDLAQRKRNLTAVTVVVTALILFGLFLRHRLRNRVVVLPILDFRYRLCAPYSGGNCARIDFKERHHHPVPSESPREH